MDSQGKKIVVCDNGTGVIWIVFDLLISSVSNRYFLIQFVKCGFAGSNFPEYVFPSLVGRPILRSSARINNIEVKV